MSKTTLFCPIFVFVNTGFFFKTCHDPLWASKQMQYTIEAASYIPLSLRPCPNIIRNFWVIDLFYCVTVLELGVDRRFMRNANDLPHYKTPAFARLTRSRADQVKQPRGNDCYICARTLLSMRLEEDFAQHVDRHLRHCYSCEKEFQSLYLTSLNHVRNGADALGCERRRTEVAFSFCAAHCYIQGVRPGVHVQR